MLMLFACAAFAQITTGPLTVQITSTPATVADAGPVRVLHVNVIQVSVSTTTPNTSRFTITITVRSVPDRSGETLPLLTLTQDVVRSASGPSVATFQINAEGSLAGPVLVTEISNPVAFAAGVN
jgi:hypothetical protein